MKSKLKSFLGSKKQVILYIVFGALTTVVDFSVSFVLYNFINPHVANVAAWVAAVIFSFAANKLLVFCSREAIFRRVLLEFLEFSGGRVASLIIQEAIFLLAVDIMNFEPEPVKLFSAVFVVIINYVFCKLVFAKGASETRKRKKKD